MRKDRRTGWGALALLPIALGTTAPTFADDADSTIAVEVRATTDHLPESPGAEAHVEGWFHDVDPGGGVGIGHFSFTAGLAPGASSESGPFPVIRGALNALAVPIGFQFDIERDRFFGGATLGFGAGGKTAEGEPFGVAAGLKGGVFTALSPGDDSPARDPSESLGVGIYGEARIPVTEWLQITAAVDGGLVLPTQSEAEFLKPGGYLEAEAGARFYVAQDPRVYVSTGFRGSGFSYEVERDGRTDTLDGFSVTGSAGVGMAF